MAEGGLPNSRVKSVYVYSDLRSAGSERHVTPDAATAVSESDIAASIADEK